MPTYNFHPVTAALRLNDAPLAYRPPRGPGIYFSVHYNHRDTSNPQVPVFSNLGPQWEIDWLSWISGNPRRLLRYQGLHVLGGLVHLRGYGTESYLGAPDSTSNFGMHWRSRATLVRTSLDPIRYERRLPDGGVEVFAMSDGAPVRQQTRVHDRVHRSTGKHDVVHLRCEPASRRHHRRDRPGDDAVYDLGRIRYASRR